MRKLGRSSLISPTLALEALKNKNTRVFDCSWFLTEERNGRKEFNDIGRIPGAQFFDIDVVADTSTDLPHMLPRPVDFQNWMRKFGLENDDDVIVYDSQFFTSFRVWWMFRLYGHESVSVLDGGFAAWQEHGFEIEKGKKEEERKPSKYLVKTFHSTWVKDYESLLGNLKNISVLDARSNARFLAEAPEPREMKKVGHMPGALSLPWDSFVVGGKFASREKIEELLQEALEQEKEGKELVTSCGSGVSAAAINFALNQIEHPPIPLYDGSWSEYGNKDDAIVAD